MIRPATFILLVLYLTACANHEGVYEPACVAYEGDRVELRSGRFEWQRFTDQRTVDDAGNDVDAFPGYPKTGAYTIDAGHMKLITNNDESLGDWFLVKHNGEHYMLTGDQHAAFLAAEELPDCALHLKRPGN